MSFSPNQTTKNPLEETHWSQVLANDLLLRFTEASCSKPHVNDDTTNEIVSLFNALGTALDNGHTVVQLSDEQHHYFKEHSHPLVSLLNTSLTHDSYSPATPIVIHHKFAYFHRQWHQENTLANKINSLISRKGDVNNTYDLTHLPSTMHTQQRLAVEKALQNRFTLITGGPGTGKTWTVAQLVLTLLRGQPDLKIALAAPTGKAAQRMQEALANNLQDNDSDTADEANLKQIAKQQLDSAKTIHRLLGLGYQTKPRFHANNALPYDLVIVDEASMLGVALANQLVQAIGSHTKLILLGDANQLAAVDAGAVLADLCRSKTLEPYHVTLTHSTRFSSDSGVGQLALATLANDLSTVHQLLSTHSAVIKVPPDNTVYEKLWQDFIPYANNVKDLFALSKTEVTANIVKLYECFDNYRVLTATHGGKLGDKLINSQLSQMLKQHTNTINNSASWFHGRPVMMLNNDYSLGLANGDIGIALYCVDDDSSTSASVGSYWVFFPHLDQPLQASRFSENTLTTAFALTIHKSQGSEFTKVAIALDAPKEDAPSLLGRELIYTAITRAKKQVTIYATDSTIDYAVNTQAIRNTGLATLLAD